MSSAGNEQIAAANMKRSLVAFVKRQTGLDVERYKFELGTRDRQENIFICLPI